MKLFPAIDLYEGKAVRLLKGNYEEMTVYSDDPLRIAKEMEAQGAEYLHTVDLEGAKNGGTPNLSVIRKIAKETSLFLEAGGGIRDMETAERCFDAGIDRIILGTAAITNEPFLQEALALYSEKIAVGADLKDGKIAIRGWLETADCTAEEFLNKMQDLGVKTVICTDISRDGAMRGTNLELYRTLCKQTKLELIASGGVSSLQDLKQLKEMGVHGAILGKAYYTGAVRLTDAIEVAK